MAESALDKYTDPSYWDSLVYEDEEEEEEEEEEFKIPVPVVEAREEAPEEDLLDKYTNPTYWEGLEPSDDEFDMEDISTERKMLYGAEQETTLTGNIIRYAQALGRTVSEDDQTFTGALQDIEDERQRDIFEKFREFRGIRQQDEDAAILTGRIGVAIADPLTWVLPWAKVAKAGKIASIAMGAGVSASDEALREQLVYGEVNPLTVGAATILGGAGGALGAALVRNKVPPAGIQKIEEILDAPTGAQAIPLNVSDTTRDVVRDYQRRFWMGASDEEFEAVEEAAERVVPRSVVEDVELNKPALTKIRSRTDKLRDKIVELGALVSATGSGSRKSLLKKELKIAKKRLEDADNKMWTGVKDRSVGRADSTLAIQEDLSASGKLTEGIIHRMVHELTRPVIGGVGGYVVSGFIGDEESSAWTMGLVGAGLAAGQYQKILQRSKLTDFEKDTAKMALEEGIINNFNRTMKIATAGTTVARLDAMGGWAKVMGNMLFNRQGATTDSVESTINRVKRDFNLQLLDIFGDSAEDLTIRRAVGEVMNEFTDIGAIRVGYTGIADNLSSLTQSQVDEIGRITPLVRDLQNTIKSGMDEVGVQFTELEHYGMAQLWDTIAIGKNVGKFTDDLRVARGKQRANGGKMFQVQAFTDNIRGIKRLKTGKQQYVKNSAFTRDGKFRPLAKHFEQERKLIDADARKFMAENGWIDMDALNVVSTYADKSIKTMEFARVFGANGEFFNHAFRDIRRAFRDAGDPKLQRFEEKYVNQMRDSVDAFWGKYGMGDNAYSSAGATSMATLVFLANTNYLPRVAITSLADLVQPFQNSGIGSSTKALLSRFNPNMVSFSKQVKFKSDNAWEREYSALQAHGGDPFNKWQTRLGDWNQKFFQVVQLQRITLAARNFAYDAGVNQAYKIARNVTRKGGKISKGTREEMGSLGLTGDDLTVLGQFKNVREAFDAGEGNVILDRIGLNAADRDAIVPLVGNRLLFTQSRNPYIRSLGQFLSWAQGKTSQTNSLVARIENGDAKMAVRMLGLTTMYAGVQQLREWAKPTYDENAHDKYSPVSTQGLKEAAELSGNWLPWHINKIVRMFQTPQNADLLANVSPSLGLIEDSWDTTFKIFRNIEDEDTEGVISNLLDVTPGGRELKGYGERSDLFEIRDRPRKGRAIGGLVEDVPGVPEEPDERIDKMTGRPYNEQAGGAFVDEEDRGPTEDLDRLGYAEGGFLSTDKENYLEQWSREGAQAKQQEWIRNQYNNMLGRVNSITGKTQWFKDEDGQPPDFSLLSGVPGQESINTRPVMYREAADNAEMANLRRSLDKMEETEFSHWSQLQLRKTPELQHGGRFGLFAEIGEFAPGRGSRGGENVRMYGMPPEGEVSKYSPIAGMYFRNLDKEGRYADEGSILGSPQHFPEFYEKVTESLPDSVSQEETIRAGDIFVEGQSMLKGSPENTAYTLWHERMHRGMYRSLGQANEYLEQYKKIVHKPEKFWTVNEKRLYEQYSGVLGSTPKEVDRNISVLDGILENGHRYINILEERYRGGVWDMFQSLELYMMELAHKEDLPIGRFTELYRDLHKWKDTLPRERIYTYEQVIPALSNETMQDYVDWSDDRIDELEQAQNIVDAMLSQDESKTRLESIKDFFLGLLFN